MDAKSFKARESTIIFSLISKYKDDILSFFSLLLIFTILLVFFWGHLGETVYDCGRQAYIPQEILNGRLSLQDLYWYFGPFILSHLINTTAFMIFGQKLSTLYIVGSLNSIIILLTSYLIARNLCSIKMSWVYLVMIICCFCFQISSSNYIFPYSYDALYATSSFLLSVFFLCQYFKTSKWFYPSLSLFFYGASLLFKYDYILLIFVILILIVFVKPLKLKQMIVSLVCFASLPLMMLILLLLLHLDLTQILFVVKHFSQVAFHKSNILLYTYCIGFYFNYSMLLMTMQQFLFMILVIFSLNITVYMALAIGTKNTKLLFVIQIFIILLILGLLYNLLTFNLDDTCFNYLFLWFPISTKIILLILIGYFLHNFWKNYYVDKLDMQSTKLKYILQNLKAAIEQVDLKHKLFLLIVLCAIAGMGKGFVFINTKTYGPILLILALLVNIIFLSDYIPLISRKINVELWKKATIILVLTIGLIFLSRNIISSINDKIVLLKTNRGVFYADAYVGPVYKELLNYINQQTSKQATFFVIPESHILNFLTNRSTGAINFYAAEYWGEEKIYQFIKSSPPDYMVLMLDWGKPPYNEKIVLNDYGSKFYNYILENYKLEKVIIKNVRLLIYKRKTIQEKPISN